MGDKSLIPSKNNLEKAGFTEPEATQRALETMSQVGAVKKIGLDRILNIALASPAPDEAVFNLSTIIKAGGCAQILEVDKIPRGLENLVFLLGASPFLSRLLQPETGLLKWLFLEDGLSLRKNREQFLCEIRETLTKQSDEEENKEISDVKVKKALRLYRLSEFLRLGARDLLGLAVMEETTQELSALAGAMLDVAIDYSRGELDGQFAPPGAAAGGFAVIGLGKLGAGELNYSSDIDIMYIYDDGDGGDRGQNNPNYPKISSGEFYTKLALKVTRLLSEITANGLVFRVDLDLRPGGKSGALVQSITGAELYYESQGREWERAAMIKADCVAGDRETGQFFLKMIRPFVYRRNLDFTAIEEIKTMKENIDLAAKKRESPGKETNVKLGRGGIREIEFFAQTMQLIHGGKDARLTRRGTLATLKVLVGKGLISSEEETRLNEAYVFLRNLEHRLQIIECRQTHTLTHGGAKERRVARMMGFKESEPFIKELKRITGSVHEVFRGLFYSSASTEEVDENITLLFSRDTDKKERQNLLQDMGFRDANRALGTLELLREGPPGLRRTSARGRAVFERAAPFLLSKILLAPDPDMALGHLENFISKAGARSTQYALLTENPAVADKLIHIFGTSDFLSKGITDRPENIDLLLSRELATPFKTKKELQDELTAEVLNGNKTFEESLDAMRGVKNGEVMRIGLNHLAGAITTAEVSEQMTLLAEAALHTAWRIALHELERTYTAPDGGKFAVIGLGKLGARELGYGSDLDIIFIYEPGGASVAQRGDRGSDISEHEFFVKLCQRIISTLTVKTREGSVFSVDTRLRPSGNSGPLVVARPAFINYHKSSTALWERQAFIRARYVAGDEALGQEAAGEAQEILYSLPLTKADIDEMLAIRKRMEIEIGKERGDRYNFKTGRGALVDIEFLVQAMQLRWGGEDKKLRQSATVEALKALARGGYLEEADYTFLSKAYAFFRDMEMRQRIVHDRSETFLSKDHELIAPLARSLGYGERADPGAALLEDYEKIRDKVRSIYKTILNGLA